MSTDDAFARMPDVPDDHAQSDVTRLLRLARAGHDDAIDQLLPLVYDELRAMARGCVVHERRGHTLDATALVHEVYLKLVRQRTIGFEDRAQFFGVASRAMRRVLVDHARTRNRTKRGGDATRTPLDDALDRYESRVPDLVALDEALDTLQRRDGRKAALVELRFFGGRSIQEAADLLDISVRTAERDWTLARAWLRAELDGGSPPDSSRSFST